ncbi:Putative auxin efflux carrier component 8 [Glycine soja]|nr:Putative auxin efflux carrier component 8 [Glycine soja]
MIGWEDVYKVVVAVVPLYFALLLGYGSLKWWNIFTKEQCEAINKLVCYFTLPLFIFEFTAHIDPFKMNFSFIAADTISKFIIMVVLALWAKCTPKCTFCWSIISFSLCNLTNAVVVGVPMVKPMYGALGVDLVVQSSVLQATIWLPLLLFVMEFWRTGIEGTTTTTVKPRSKTMINKNEGGGGKDVEAVDVKEELMLEESVTSRLPFCKVMKLVWRKLATNPNSYGCVIGIYPTVLSDHMLPLESRHNTRMWNLEMPSMLEGSIQIMSKAGTGTAMFSMGIFMALQEKLIACGPSMTLIGLVLKFIAGPAATAIGAIAVGLRGDVLRVVIIQAAVPQSITSFIFAKEYGLHPEVLSTAVIFGMIVSLPVLVAYYAILEFVH